MVLRHSVGEYVAAFFYKNPFHKKRIFFYAKMRSSSRARVAAFFCLIHFVSFTIYFVQSFLLRVRI